MQGRSSMSIQHGQLCSKSGGSPTAIVNITACCRGPHSPVRSALALRGDFEPILPDHPRPGAPAKRQRQRCGRRRRQSRCPPARVRQLLAVCRASTRLTASGAAVGAGERCTGARGDFRSPAGTGDVEGRVTTTKRGEFVPSCPAAVVESVSSLSLSPSRQERPALHRLSPLGDERRTTDRRYQAWRRWRKMDHLPWVGPHERNQVKA